MPKLLVLFDGRRDDIALLADAVAEGARRVRFAEVDVRRISDAATDGSAVTRHRALESAEALATYDGIIVGVGAEESGRNAVIAALASAPSLADKVGSAFVVMPPNGDGQRDVLWSVVAPMLDRGMILVQPPVSDTPVEGAESAGAQGKRVADVIGWITHARSHHHHH